MANTAWALATAGFLELPLLRELQARAAVLADGFNAVELKQLYQVDVTIRLEDPTYGVHTSVIPYLRSVHTLCMRGVYIGTWSDPYSEPQQQWHICELIAQIYCTHFSTPRYTRGNIWSVQRFHPLGMKAVI